MNLVKVSGAVTFAVVAACTVDPRIDAGQAQGQYPGVPPGGVMPGMAPCQFDTRTVVDNVEIITSRGRLFMFSSGAPIQPGTSFMPPAFGAYGAPIAAPYPGAVVPTTPYAAAPYANPYAAPIAPGLGAGAVDLMSVPLYAQGPCLGMPPGGCTFETQAFVRLNPASLREYVTAGGRQWVFENSQIVGAGLPLASIPRYQSICGATYGGACVFDTRAFVKQGDQIIESITAFGRRFEIDIDGRPLQGNGIDLTQSPRYATGPCMGAPPGTCAFESRSFEAAPTGQLLETITANGSFFSFLADTGAVFQPAVPTAAARPYLANACL